MLGYLFPRFLVDAQEYAAAQAYWQELCDSVLARHGQAGRWRPWLNTTYADGTPARDGNPIFHLLKDDHSKAFRALQVEPSSAHVDLGAWVTSLADWFDDCPTAAELVVHCKLTPATAQAAASLFAAWIQDSTTPEAMRALIATLGE